MPSSSNQGPASLITKVCTNSAEFPVEAQRWSISVSWFHVGLASAHVTNKLQQPSGDPYPCHAVLSHANYQRPLLDKNHLGQNMLLMICGILRRHWTLSFVMSFEWWSSKPLIGQNVMRFALLCLAWLEGPMLMVLPKLRQASASTACLSLSALIQH